MLCYKIVMQMLTKLSITGAKFYIIDSLVTTLLFFAETLTFVN